YLDQTGTGISSTIDSVGPLYIFRNVWDRNEFIQGSACDSDQKQPMFKDGSSSDFGNGRRYLFHNTMLQRTQSGCNNGLGGGAGVGGTGDAQLVHNTVSMNNIYNLWKPQNGPFFQIGTDNTFQNDMMATVGVPEIGVVLGRPQYAAGNGDMAGDSGLYALAAGTPGYDQGIRIPNFNDHFNGVAPDVGAMEAGDGAMMFGVAAATSSSSADGSGGTGGGSGGGSSGGSTPPPVTNAPVSATMDSSSYTVKQGARVTFTAAVMGNAGTPTGAVSFTANNTPISGCSAVALSAGKATCSTSLKRGSFQIRGNYSGDATYGAGVAGPITETVK
ncbi:MAG TPA: Ig-like domain-containing protein, partial [Usitatibacter sp.]|nr:Ig-like domain-containing protein [Usitatibacter sp.]